MLQKYAEVFTEILQLEKEVKSAKFQLVAGESPYVSLSIVRNLAESAMTSWHTIESRKEGN